MKTAVITGASRGIGFATAQEFIANGWRVVGTSTTGRIGLRSPAFTPVRLDYLEPSTISEAIEDIQGLGAPIDVLVNNAAVAWVENSPTVDIGVLRKTLEVNLVGQIDFTNQMLPLLGRFAHIINISSNAANLSTFKFEPPLMPAYKISKAAFNMYTRIASEQLRDKNITVSALDPRWTRTAMGAVNGKRAPRPADIPAQEIYALATATDAATGRLWREYKEASW